MKITNKKILIICLAIILVATVGLFLKKNNLDRFLNYNEKKHTYTRFSFVVNEENIMYSRIMEYRKIEDISEKDYLKKLSAKIENFQQYINYAKEQNELSKDSIQFLKGIKNLTQTEYVPPEKEDVAINVIVQDKKILLQEGFNYYEAELKIYLKDGIMALEDLGVKGGNNGGSVLYFKIDNITEQSINMLISQAKRKM